MKERNRKYETKRPRWCKGDCWECKWSTTLHYHTQEPICDRADELHNWFIEKIKTIKEEL